MHVSLLILSLSNISVNDLKEETELVPLASLQVAPNLVCRWDPVSSYSRSSPYSSSGKSHPFCPVVCLHLCSYRWRLFLEDLFPSFQIFSNKGTSRLFKL